MPVAQTRKLLAWLFVATTTFCVVFLSVSQCNTKPYYWQVLLIYTFVFHAFLDVIVYATVKCTVVHYWLPCVVQDSVFDVFVTLNDVVMKACSSKSNSDASRHLDCTRHLFVSKIVSQKFPFLIESTLVNSYQDWLGGRHRRKRYDESTGFWNILRRFLLRHPILSDFLMHSMLPAAIIVALLCLPPAHAFRTVLALCGLGVIIVAVMLYQYDSEDRRWLKKTSAVSLSIASDDCVKVKLGMECGKDFEPISPK